MENRLKELKLQLFSIRTSCTKFIANQLRILLSAAAYILFEALRSDELANTELKNAQCSTIRLKLIKIGARIVENTRRIILSISESYPY